MAVAKSKQVLALGVSLGCFLSASANELIISDFDDQSVFNRFSGDSGSFASGRASFTGNFDTRVFRGSFGASMRIEYSVPSGFCGAWNSLLGKAAFPQYALNFTNLHGALRNSADHPSWVEGVRVKALSLWARGNGRGDFLHRLKVELKGPGGSLGDTVFEIPNDTTWRRYDFALGSLLNNTNAGAVKELVLVLEHWRNDDRTNATFHLDDITLVTDEPNIDPSRWSDDAMLDAVAHRTFSYFLRFQDKLGFALDRSTFSDMVSVGTIGFQLTAYCIGHQREWADRADLEQRVLKVLQNLKNLPMGPEPGTVRAGYRGFYYHFLSSETGLRKDVNVELSLYDTALLMYGVLSCREYFATDAEIVSLAQELYDRVEWDWFVDKRAGPNQHQFYLEWKPNAAGGRFDGHVDGQTDEALMVDILALGSTTHPITIDTYFARRRSFGSYPDRNGPPILASWRGSLFNYFFASCWLDFESRGMDLHAFNPVDLWRNNRLAIEANREFCIRHSRNSGSGTNGVYSTYGENSWGLTACDNLVAPNAPAPSEYFSFGALPTEENLRFNTRAPHVGTIAVYGAASAINYTPAESIAAIRHFFTVPALWSPLFGFGDAFSLDPHYTEAPYDAEGNPTIKSAAYLNGPWVNSMLMGVDVGPMLLAIENHRTGDVWHWTSRNPNIEAGLDRIFGITTADVDLLSAIESNGEVRLRWKPVRSASRYAVYTSSNLADWKLLQDGIAGTEWHDTKRPPGTQRFYLVKAIR